MMKTMNICLNEAQHSDLPFLREMLYEGVFWRASADKPSFEEGLALPEVKKQLADWGRRAGDTAVVATIESVPVGAAWYRFWTDDRPCSGYIGKHTPVLAIAVHRNYRNQGIGTRMLGWLIDRAAEHSIQAVSLSVSKDNRAKKLYRRLGFEEYVDRGDAFTMVRRV